MTRLVLPLPVPALRLSTWSTSQFDAWERHTARATELTRGAGTGRNFAALVAEAHALLRGANQSALTARLGDRRFVRALVTVWQDDAALARSTMSRELLGHLAERTPSRLTTITFVMLFFEHFDRLDTWQDGLFASARDFLRSAVAGQPTRSSGDVIEAIREYDGFVLELKGPRHLADELVSADIDVTEWLRLTRMTPYADSRFGRIVRDAFYLAQIDAADAEQSDHPFLRPVTDEVLTRQKAESTDEDGLYFGHQVLTALTAKATRRPSTEWLGAAIGIAGDPRMAQTAQWLTWWSKVPEENLARARRWMRGMDLRAFLDGVEKYAGATYNDDLERMLERRKRLLLGLYEQDLVEDVRLILGSDIRTWIARSAPLGLQDVARLEDASKADTAVVYIDCGDFWLVEGTHNFKLHIYTEGPVRALADRNRRSFSGGFLRDEVPARHESEYGEEAWFSVAHQGFEWVRRALDYLRDSGIEVDEVGLMTSNDYAELSRRRQRDWY